MKGRHAYLLCIHKNINQVKKLLELLDYEQNDIYIHCDKKATEIKDDDLRSIVKKSRIYFIDRKDIRWGNSNQISVEMELLKVSGDKHYEYYHFISGQDMPLKSQEDIHKFFKSNGTNTNYVHFCSKEETDNIISKRIKIYSFFVGSSNVVLKTLSRGLSFFQRKLHVNRIKPSIEYGYGSNWFSITDDLAQYILGQINFCKKNFSYGICGDEIFLQTIILNSKFKDTLYLNVEDEYKQCMRLVDFKRGNGNNPYIFTKEDLKQLKTGEYLFARKFDENVDSEVIDIIYNTIKAKVKL